MPERRQPPPRGGKKLAGIDTKWWLIGGSVVAIFVYYSYRKTRATASAASADPTQGGTIDPATGLPYNQEYAGIGSGAGAMGSPYSLAPSTVAVGTPLPANNADWYSNAVAALESHGYTEIAATSAIGAYLLGIPLTHDQLGTVQAATALVGPPPDAVTVHMLPAVSPTPTTRTMTGTRPTGTPRTSAGAYPGPGSSVLRRIGWTPPTTTTQPPSTRTWQPT